jgi:hypothetical protein
MSAIAPSPRATFRAGNASLTRLVKRLAKEKGVEVETNSVWNGYGYETYSYSVDEQVLAAAQSVIDAKEARERAKVAAKQLEYAEKAEQLEAQQLQDWRDSIVKQYPKLIIELPSNIPIYNNAADIDITYMTKTDWRKLGIVVERPTAYLITREGAKVVPLYSGGKPTFSRRRNMSAEQLWQDYQDRGLSLTHAIWAVNRLVKLFPANKEAVYRLKDKFLSNNPNLREGRFVREEKRYCWCGGDDEFCYKCDGTGIYSKRKLYEHLIDDNGKLYSFHSFVRPELLSEEEGVDLPSYGRRLKKDNMPLFRIEEYIRMLERALRVGGIR